MARSRLNSRSLYRRAAFAALCFMFSGGLADAKATYTTFVAGFVRGINAINSVTGYRGGGDSFVRTADGTVTTFAVTGAKETQAESINNGSEIAGYYLDNSDAGHGFLRASNGTITTFDVTGASGTYPVSLNNKGEIAGSYGDDAGAHGFVRTTGGRIKTIDVPGSSDTQASSISDKGVIVGTYVVDGRSHTFVRAADGTITAIDVPGAVATDATRINAKGTIAGFYSDSGGTIHGFVRTADGTITAFDGPGCDFIQPMGINSKGAISGYCISLKHRGHYTGFARRPNGTFQTFQVPGGGTRTMPAGINDAGVIAGDYAFGNFLRFP